MIVLVVMIVVCANPVTHSNDRIDLPASLQEGIRLIKSGRPQEAVLTLEHAKSQHPDNVEVRIMLGDAYLQLKKYQLSLDEYSAMIQQNPQNIAAILGRTSSLIGLGDARKAADTARMATEIAPERTDGWILLGDAYVHETHQDYPRAIEAYKKALSMEPKNLQLALSLAKAYNHKKDNERAAVVLEEARKHHARNPELLVKLAESYFVLRKLDRAKELIDIALDLQPEDVHTLAVAKQIQNRKDYQLWVPVFAIFAFPLLWLLIRWMRKGKVPKL